MKIRHLAIGIALFTLAGIGHAADGPRAMTPKPGAAVAVAVDGDGQLRTGVQTRLDLRFTGKPDSVLSVEYRSEDGLLLRSQPTVQLRSNLHGVATDTPMVEAVADGIHYLNVFITQNNRTRAVSIRLTAGDTARAARKLGGEPSQHQLPSPGEPGTTGQGEPLVILPAD